MDANTAFLKSKFREYYLKSDVILPPRFTRREYGFMFFDKKFVLRHKRFDNKKQLKRFLVDYVPKHAYYSTAYYINPSEQDMEEKGWLGADLIFDLDADHIPETEGKSYEEMLAIVKKETEKLIFGFLLGDMGFNEQDLFLSFSGGRGYHVYVRTEKVFRLSSDERREIVNYITGEAVDINRFILKDRIKIGRKKMRELYYLYPYEYGGWYSKIHRGITEESRRLFEIYKNAGKEELVNEIDKIIKNKKLSKKIVRELLEESKEYTTKIEYLARSDESQKLQIFNDDGIRDAFIQYIKEKLRIRSEIDEPVTTDIHRLIRLTGSLHGKTGFIVKPLSIEEFKKFDPLIDAIPETFKNENSKVNPRIKIDLSLNGRKFIFNEEKCVPDYLAIFLIARGMADFVARC